MSYWAHNPELYDEIIVKEAKARGIVEEDDDRFDGDIVAELMKTDHYIPLAQSAEAEYWGSKIDELANRREDR
jgi:hypothetical protein